MEESKEVARSVAPERERGRDDDDHGVSPAVTASAVKTKSASAVGGRRKTGSRALWATATAMK